MDKLERFKTQDLSDKMKVLYTDYCNDVAELIRENRELSSDLLLIKRESSILKRLLLVSMSANALILGIVL